jgi:hypothetical protein
MNTRAAVTLVVTVMVVAMPSFAARADVSIETVGEGAISVCRDWDMVGKSCRKYHHVKLPSSISVGDTFRVDNSFTSAGS